jgi:hypothetical protein
MSDGAVLPPYFDTHTTSDQLNNAVEEVVDYFPLWLPIRGADGDDDQVP